MESPNALNGSMLNAVLDAVGVAMRGAVAISVDNAVARAVGGAVYLSVGGAVAGAVINHLRDYHEND